MPFILQKVGTVPNIPTQYFECDNESDLSLIDVTYVPMTSECYVINSGATYVLNSDKEWKLKPTSSSGGSSDAISDGGEEV